MRATRQNLQTRPKILKKYQNIKSTNQNENFPKKSMFSTLKVYRNQKFVWGLPDEISRESPKNNRTQVKFRKPLTCKGEVSRLKGKKVMWITKFADRRQTDGNYFFVKNHFFIDKKF
jgi:hypothetical protein